MIVAIDLYLYKLNIDLIQIIGVIYLLVLHLESVICTLLDTQILSIASMDMISTSAFDDFEVITVGVTKDQLVIAVEAHGLEAGLWKQHLKAPMMKQIKYI